MRSKKEKESILVNVARPQGLIMVLKKTIQRTQTSRGETLRNEGVVEFPTVVVPMTKAKRQNPESLKQRRNLILKINAQKPALRRAFLLSTPYTQGLPPPLVDRGAWLAYTP